MSITSIFVVMATLPIEYKYHNLGNVRNIQAHLGGYIWLHARTKEEFVQAAISYLDSFKMMAEAFMPRLSLNYDDCTIIAKVQRLIANVAKVDRDEYVLKIGEQWDKYSI